MKHSWTGNVRELKNMIERGVLIGKEPELTLGDLGLEGVAQEIESEQGVEKFRFPPIPPAGVDLSAIERSLEKFYIEEALKMAEGNESKAAKLLNINHHTYRYRRKRLK